LSVLSVTLVEAWCESNGRRCTAAGVAGGTSFLWLELTGRCQLPVDRTTGRHADEV
jgi:hypothetical protein